MSIKKIIISETQYNKLKSLLLENKVSSIVKNNKYTNGKPFEVDDFLLITFNNGKKYTFIIDGFLSDGFRLKDENSGRVIILNSTSFKGDGSVELYELGKGGKHVSKITLKLVETLTFFNETKENTKSFKLDDINFEEEDDNEDNEENDKHTEKDGLNELKSELSRPNVGFIYKLLSSDKSFITFKVVEKVLNDIVINIIEVSNYGELGKFSSLENEQVRYGGVNDIKVNEQENTLEIKINYEKEGSTDNQLINGIVNVSKSEVDEKISELSDTEIMDLILSKGNLEDAFIKKKSLWASMMGKERKGIDRARKILDRVFGRTSNINNNNAEKLRKIFKQEQTLKFTMIGEDIYIEDKYKLISDVTHTGKVELKNDDGVNVKLETPIGHEPKKPDMIIYNIKDESESLYRAEFIVDEKGGAKNIKRTIKVTKKLG